MSFYNNNQIKTKITNKNDLKIALKHIINVFLINTENKINLYKYKKDKDNFTILFSTIENLKNGFVKNVARTVQKISQN